MATKTFRNLRSVSLLAFFIALLLLASSLFVCIAPQKVNVYDNENKIIGEARIPHSYEDDIFLSIALVVLTGIQFWTILALGKDINKKSQPND